MTRIGRMFEERKRAGRKSLIAYLTAGDPRRSARPRWSKRCCAAART